MMHSMMGGAMMWSMGLWGLALIILVVLSITALAKYLISK